MWTDCWSPLSREYLERMSRPYVDGLLVRKLLFLRYRGVPSLCGRIVGRSYLRSFPRTRPVPMWTDCCKVIFDIFLFLRSRPYVDGLLMRLILRMRCIEVPSLCGRIVGSHNRVCLERCSPVPMWTDCWQENLGSTNIFSSRPYVDGLLDFM